MTKTAKQIAHEQHNASAKAAAAQAKADRLLGHVERNNQASVNAATARALRAAQIEERALASATQAFAEHIESLYGIPANDNAAIAQAA